MSLDSQRALLTSAIYIQMSLRYDYSVLLLYYQLFKNVIIMYSRKRNTRNTEIRDKPFHLDYLINKITNINYLKVTV